MNKDYIIIKNAVDANLCKFLSLEFEMMEAVCKQMYPGQSLADLCENTFARYSPLMMEALSIWMQPVIEEAVEMKLYPTYSYARIYYKGSELQKHFDRETSEVSVSVCLQKDVDWPLYVENSEGVIHQLDLEVGDIAIYSGRKHKHWRNPLPGEKQIQAFLQYVDANGTSAWLKWDTRPVLGMPFESADFRVQDEIKRIASVRDLLKNTGL